MSVRTDIVVTTIFEPAWLEGYLRNLRAHGRMDSTTLRIICDRKTPDSVYAAARDAAAQGFAIDCPTLEEQQAYLERLAAPAELVPWNTDNRRNIGFLRALESGADVLISIDDDNYCPEDVDFVGEHGVVGAAAAPETVSRVASGAPWFNICELIDFGGAAPVYARGFPYRARVAEATAALSTLEAPPARGGARIAVNAGLWLDDPDVDALTRLTLAPQGRAARPESVLLGPQTWSPINTQNTAMLREAIPAYYYVRMGFPLQGMRIDRFGDILSGYFLQAVAKHLGDGIRIGSPVAAHRRSPHDLFKDLYHELAGVVLIEELVPWLRELTLEGDDYATTYASLAQALEDGAERFRGFVWDEGGRDFLRETAGCMRDWLALVARIRGA